MPFLIDAKQQARQIRNICHAQAEFFFPNLLLIDYVMDRSQCGEPTLPDLEDYKILPGISLLVPARLQILFLESPVWRAVGYLILDLQCKGMACILSRKVPPERYLWDMTRNT